MTADERRDAIVAAATEEFATGGLVGASTEAIARQAGVSQPYVFQLFGTKKDLFLAVVRSCFARATPRVRGRGPRLTARSDPECDSRPRGDGRRSTSASSPTGRCSWSSSRPTPRARIRTSGPSSAKSCGSSTAASREAVRRVSARSSTSSSREGMLLNLGAAIGLPGEAKNWSLEMFEGGA